MSSKRVTQLNNQSLHLTDVELKSVEKFSVSLPLNELPEIVVVPGEKPAPIQTASDAPATIPFEQPANQRNASQESGSRAGAVQVNVADDAIEMPVDEIDISNADDRGPAENVVPSSANTDPSTTETGSSSPDISNSNMETSDSEPAESSVPQLHVAGKNAEVESLPPATFQIDSYTGCQDRFERITKSIEEGFDPSSPTVIVFTSPESQDIEFEQTRSDSVRQTAVQNILSLLAQRNPTLNMISLQADHEPVDVEQEFSLGIGEVLSDQNSLEEVVIPTTLDNLDYIAYSDCDEVLESVSASSKPASVLNELKRHYDLIVVTTRNPAAALTPIWAKLADCTYLHLHMMLDSEDRAQDAARRLRQAGARLMGCIVTEDE